MRIAAAVVGVLLVVVYALGSGRWVSTGSDWYLALQQPAWQPPPGVFGLAWAYNFTALAVVCVVMAWRGAPIAVWSFLGIFAVSIALAIGWAYLFYGPHALVAAAICLTLTAAVTVALVAIAWSQVVWLGVVLIPYAIWLIIATSLSWGYVALSPLPTR